ncbi:carboxylating nicotinate-nucleotide diphosphorylase [soil metagenome]
MEESVFNSRLQHFIQEALAEDVGDGDHSTLSCIPEHATGKAILKIKDHGTISGLEIAKAIFNHVEPASHFVFYKKDGEQMAAGENAFEVQAKIRTILLCERLVLNCMQRMSGITTLTKKFVQKLDGYATKLLDTRKTTPNFRLLEKEAVRIGGGFNHRFGLYDMIMLKDNHIDYCGGIRPAIEQAWKYVQQNKPGLKIEIETRNISDVQTVLEVGKVDRIMLDNFTLAEITEALKLINGKFETEASGGINIENLESYAATGVNFISSGAIIHQAGSLNLSLKAQIQ